MGRSTRGEQMTKREEIAKIEIELLMNPHNAIYSHDFIKSEAIKHYNRRHIMDFFPKVKWVK